MKRKSVPMLKESRHYSRGFLNWGYPFWDSFTEECTYTLLGGGGVCWGTPMLGYAHIKSWTELMAEMDSHALPLMDMGHGR